MHKFFLLFIKYVISYFSCFFWTSCLQDFHGADDDIPSAPPLFNPVLESNQVAKQFKVTRTGVSTILATSDSSTTGHVASACNRKTLGANEEDVGSSARYI